MPSDDSIPTYLHLALNAYSEDAVTGRKQTDCINLTIYVGSPAKFAFI